MKRAILIFAPPPPTHKLTHTHTHTHAHTHTPVFWKFGRFARFL